MKKEVFQSCLFAMCGVLWWGFLYPDLTLIPGETVEVSDEAYRTYDISSEGEDSEELQQLIERFLDGDFTLEPDSDTNAEKIIIKSRLMDFLHSIQD